MTKHLILTVLTATLANICAGQSLNDTIYYNKNWKKVNDKSSASFYRLYNASDTTEGRKPYRDYYISGKLQGEGTIVWENGRMVEDGPQKNYYKNGKIHKSWYKSNGLHDDGDTTFHKSGRIKHISYYGNDTKIRRQLWEEREPLLKTLDYEAYYNKYARFTYWHCTIPPTLKNLTLLVDCSSNRFIKLMEAYGYRLPEDTAVLDKSHFLYTNKNSYVRGDYGDNYVELSRKDNHARIFGKLERLYPRTVISKLKDELKPYYDEHNSHYNLERYVINDSKGGCYAFEFYLTENMDYLVDVWHFNKDPDWETIEKQHPWSWVGRRSEFTDFFFSNKDDVEVSDNDNPRSSCVLFNPNNYFTSDYKEYCLLEGLVDLVREGVFTDVDTTGGKHLVKNYRQQTFHSNGKVFWQYFVKNGIKDGSFMSFFDNGRLRSRANYKNGELDGDYISYYKNGDIKFKGVYSNGVLVNESGSPIETTITEIDSIDFNGRFGEYLKEEGLLKNGLLDGYYYTYHDNGVVKTKSFYVDGKKEGEEITYFDDGELKRQSFYVNGLLNGKVIEFDNNTLDYPQNGYAQVLNYKNGKLDDRQIAYRHYNKDSIWCEDIYEDGTLQKEVVYNDDGSVRRIFTPINTTTNGDTVSFNYNHTLLYTEDEYTDNSKISIDIHQVFIPLIKDENGMLRDNNGTILLGIPSKEDSRYDPSKHPFEYARMETHNGYVMSSYGINTSILKNSLKGVAHGKYQLFDRQNRITSEGQYTYGTPYGIWKVYNYEGNIGYYRTIDYDNSDNVIRYYTLDNKPYSGTVTDYYSDSNKSTGSVKDGFREGLWIGYEPNGEIYNKVNYLLGQEDGECFYYYNDKNIYQVISYNVPFTPRRFYTLDDQPYTGVQEFQIDKDANNGADSLVVIIQYSLITEEQYVNSESGQIIKTTKYQNGLPIE